MAYPPPRKGEDAFSRLPPKGGVMPDTTSLSALALVWSE